MKKTFKIFGIIALTAVIGFSMAACSDSENYPDPPKQFITVTDIPYTYNNMYGIILLYPPNSSDFTVYSALEKIDTSVNFPLYNWGKNNPWEGSGNFSVKILIFENSTTEQWTYAGVTPEMSITSTTAITWSSFIRK